MNRSVFAAVAIVIIGGVVWYLVSLGKIQPTASGQAAVGGTYSWQITDLGENAGAPGVPRSGLVLTFSGQRYPIGEYDGACSEIKGTSWPLLQNEVSGVICWWAGGGSEVGLFSQNGTVLVREGQLDEGNAETPGVRGNFKTLLTL